MLFCVPTFSRPLRRGPLGLLSVGLGLFTSIAASKPIPFGGGCGNVTTPLQMTTGQRSLKLDFFGYTAWADFEIGIDKPGPNGFVPASRTPSAPFVHAASAFDHFAPSYFNSTRPGHACAIASSHYGHLRFAHLCDPPDNRFDLVVSTVQSADFRAHYDGEGDLRRRLRAEFHNRQLRHQLDIAGKAAVQREQELQQQLDLLTQLLEAREAEHFNATSTFGGVAHKLASLLYNSLCSFFSAAAERSKTALFSPLISPIAFAVMCLVLSRRTKSALCSLLYGRYTYLRALPWPPIGSVPSAITLSLLGVLQSLARSTPRWTPSLFTCTSGAKARANLRALSWPLIGSAVSLITVALLSLLQSLAHGILRRIVSRFSSARSRRTRPRNRRNAPSATTSLRELDVASHPYILPAGFDPLETLDTSEAAIRRYNALNAEIHKHASHCAAAVKLVTLPGTSSFPDPHPIIATLERSNCQAPSIWDSNFGVAHNEAAMPRPSNRKLRKRAKRRRSGTVAD